MHCCWCCLNVLTLCLTLRLHVIMSLPWISRQNWGAAISFQGRPAQETVPWSALLQHLHTRDGHVQVPDHRKDGGMRPLVLRGHKTSQSWLTRANEVPKACPIVLPSWPSAKHKQLLWNQGARVSSVREPPLWVSLPGWVEALRLRPDPGQVGMLAPLPARRLFALVCGAGTPPSHLLPTPLPPWSEKHGQTGVLWPPPHQHCTRYV